MIESYWHTSTPSTWDSCIPNNSWAAQAATPIVGQLHDQGRVCKGGAVTWLAGGDEAGVAPVALGPHLYDGTSGIAFFLAAYHHVTGEAEARNLALRAIAPLRARMSQLAADPQRARELRLAIGGLIGLGSFLYMFVRLAEWLRESELLQSACDVMALITPERIAEDDRLDVMAGCAGTLLALLAMDREDSRVRSRGLDPLALARACGRHLIARRAVISGFAHGAAGIACALMRLYERTGEEEFREAALEGFAYERGLYDPEARNWLDPRFGRLLEQSAWCHGAPGMALGRLAAAGLPEIGHDLDHNLEEDLEEALSITCSLPDSPIDSLCCGNLGRAEILWTAGRALDRPSLAEAACGLAERVLARGNFVFEIPEDETGGPVKPRFQPSFFLGLAGAGYSLLRLAYPDRLPCVLLLE